jgi:hypothetical protein
MPTGREISVLTIGIFLPTAAATKPYLSNHELLFEISSLLFLNHSAGLLISRPSSNQLVIPLSKL